MSLMRMFERLAPAHQHWIARRLDADSDGSLSPSEAGKLLATKTAGELSGAAADARFAELDQSGDGKLQLPELTGSQMFAPDTLQALMAELDLGLTFGSDVALLDAARERMFESVDADGSGKLSASELARYGGADPGNDATRSVMAAIDTNGDGGVSLQEAIDTRLLETRRMDAAAANRAGAARSVNAPVALAEWMVGQADADGDGVLSSAEFDVLRGDHVKSRSGTAEQTDADHDGFISAFELSRGLDGDYWSVAARKLDAGPIADPTVAKLDQDGDGALASDELAVAASASGVAAILLDLDRNDDGKLSRAEMQTAIAERADFYATGAWKGDIRTRAGFPSESETALARLLWNRLSGMMDEIAQGPGKADLRA
jgi:Ca2+-binding EF-hand superfamily protein